MPVQCLEQHLNQPDLTVHIDMSGSTRPDLEPLKALGLVSGDRAPMPVGPCTSVLLT